MNKENSPAVSVVIPVYCHNEQLKKYLGEALESVAKQTFRDFEVVLVDDASPVDIAPLLGEMSGLPDLRVIRNEPNLGHVESRNKGIKEARGSLIALLDHDDLWVETKLEEQVRAFKGNPDVAMVFCDIEVIGSQSSLLEVDQTNVPIRPSFGYLSTHIRTIVTSSAVMVKKETMEEIGGFDPRYTSCDDYDAWLKILMRHPILRIPRRLAYYRLHESNVNYSVDSRNDQKLLTELIIGYWKTVPLLDKIRLLPSVLRKLAGRIYFSLRAMRTEGK